jgi:hypothetical protein
VCGLSELGMYGHTQVVRRIGVSLDKRAGLPDPSWNGIGPALESESQFEEQLTALVSKHTSKQGLQGAARSSSSARNQ